MGPSIASSTTRCELGAGEGGKENHGAGGDALLLLVTHAFKSLRKVRGKIQLVIEIY
jgi:hypothetical protein